MCGQLPRFGGHSSTGEDGGRLTKSVTVNGQPLQNSRGYVGIRASAAGQFGAGYVGICQPPRGGSYCTHQARHPNPALSSSGKVPGKIRGSAPAFSRRASSRGASRPAGLMLMVQARATVRHSPSDAAMAIASQLTNHGAPPTLCSCVLVDRWKLRRRSGAFSSTPLIRRLHRADDAEPSSSTSSQARSCENLFGHTTLSARRDRRPCRLLSGRDWRDRGRTRLRPGCAAMSFIKVCECVRSALAFTRYHSSL